MTILMTPAQISAELDGALSVPAIEFLEDFFDEAAIDAMYLRDLLYYFRELTPDEYWDEFGIGDNDYCLGQLRNGNYLITDR